MERGSGGRRGSFEQNSGGLSMTQNHAREPGAENVTLRTAPLSSSNELTLGCLEKMMMKMKEMLTSYGKTKPQTKMILKWRAMEII